MSVPSARFEETLESASPDLLREMITGFAQRMMDADAEVRRNGLRRSELPGRARAEVDLAARRVHVRQAQVDDALDSTKSEDSERQIVIDKAPPTC